MTQLTSLLLIKGVLLSGLALWLAVIVLNNAVAFRNGVFSIGLLMGMQLFDQEPAIRTPLLSRASRMPYGIARSSASFW
ncbi:hypothetical protein [Ensifer sp. LC163]|uniref:hypothetical protein n=1 Tax=Ensifer sp. LC163 TaxID=1120652 RepID=UPI0009F6FC68|nr:hypothetical protein [Ensifer sp. LC163]